jgi:hypothetical protein
MRGYVPHLQTEADITSSIVSSSGFLCAQKKGAGVENHPG